jgi:hypothetical protein
MELGEEAWRRQRSWLLAQDVGDRPIPKRFIVVVRVQAIFIVVQWSGILDLGTKRG